MQTGEIFLVLYVGSFVNDLSRKTMAFSGHLSEFTLPELLRFLEQGYKTGLLTIQSLPTIAAPAVVNYIWLQQGRIVAAADSLDGQGLVAMMAKRGWVSEPMALRCFQQFAKRPSHQNCPQNTALGLCLKSQGLLQAEQLKLLFRKQVFGQVSALFQLADGLFEFEPKAPLPATEMTGLSVPATEAALVGLRTLRDWTALAAQLPEPSSGLTSTVKGHPPMQLDTLEWQVWEYVNGKVSLRTIAQELGLTIAKVQQVAYRLTVSNIAEEVFISTFDSIAFDAEMVATVDNWQESEGEFVSQVNVSQSFFKNLFGFLRDRMAN